MSEKQKMFQKIESMLSEYESSGPVCINDFYFLLLKIHDDWNKLTADEDRIKI